MANFLVFLGILSFCQALNYDAKIEHKFNWINFTFNSTSDSQNYFNNKVYHSCMPAGIKISSTGTIYVSVPRWNPGVPSTLNVLLSTNLEVALLQPFPSWAGNEANNPAALQSVLGFEIDLEDNIWVLDQSKINGVFVPGGAKVNKYNQQGTLLMSYNLSAVTNPEYSFLNDLVLDTKNNFIYISDSGAGYSGFIVIDLNKETGNIWRALTNDPTTIPDPSHWVVINGKRVNQNAPMETGVDGIALSCDRRYLYYTPLTSQTLYYIETQYLREPNLADISSKAVWLGFKKSASDGLMASEKGRLYITAIELNAVLKVNDMTTNPVDLHYADFKYVINSTHAVWPDTLGFDNKHKRIYAMCNQLQNFVSGNINFETPVNGDANFYLWSAYVDDRSYLEGCDYSSGDNVGIGFPTWGILLLVISLIILAAVIGCVIRHFILAKRRRTEGLIN